MKVAAVQMVSAMSVPVNLARARILLEQAAGAGVELAVLPEYFCLLGHKDTDKLAVQEPFGDGPIQAFLSTCARDLKLWIVGGTLPLSMVPAADSMQDGLARQQVTNTSLAFAPDGRCMARYDKIHLFRFDNGAERYDESRVLQAGSKLAVFTLPSRDGQVWRIGMSVCYDLRFPELYRHYAEDSVDILLVPSAFTHLTGQAHWEILLKARAIENQAFVLAPAQGGVHENGRQTWGHSLIVGPWGEVLGVLPEGEGVVIAELDHGQRATCAARLPALAHRVL
jgi:deaminated glutathione amidase